jgi:hypothetical integral membrane protein (TIGR02206 family)
MTLAASWWTSFTPFSAQHAVSVVFWCGIFAAVAALGRRCRGTPREGRVRAAWLATLLLTQVYTAAWYLFPANFDIGVSLPLHYCDMTVWIAAAALWSQSRWLRSVLFFWGFALSTQAFITPTLREGMGHPRYWFFFMNHMFIVGSAVYDVVALRFRPTVRDFGTASAALAVYACLIMPVNVVAGANYGFIGDSKPDAPTILDKLGPWPDRILLIWLLAQTAMLLVYAISLGVGRLSPADDASGPLRTLAPGPRS